MLSWSLGLKANALYRDGSKLSQPLSASLIEDDEDAEEVLTEAPQAERVAVLAEKIVERIIYKEIERANRQRLPERRKGYTQKAIVGGHKVYLRTGEYAGRPARRDLHRHAQGRRGLPGDDEQLRHRGLARPPVRRAAGGVRRRLHLHPLRAGGRWCRATTRIKNATSILDYIFRELAVSYLDRTDLAHVKPTGESFDDLGRGEEERAAGNVARLDGEMAHSSIAVIKQLSSTGYLRKRLPQELMVLQGGAAVAGALDLGALSGLAVRGTVEASVTAIDARTKAKMQGYEGDPCGECGNFTLVRNGTCMKCNTCGSTSGCS